MTVPFAGKITVVPEVLVKLLGGEAVLLHTTQQRYYGLDEVGTRMWTELTASSSINIAYQHLLDQYEVDPMVLRRDLAELVERLARHGLVRLTADA